MGDVFCAKCGEPWDAYGVHEKLDMDEEEATMFLQGKGCPSCGFAEKPIYSEKHMASVLEETDDPDAMLDLLFGQKKKKAGKP